MSSPKYEQFKKNLLKCQDVVLLNSAKGGITAADLAKELGMHKTRIHHLLNTLQVMKEVEDHHGIWCVRPKEQTTKPEEKEIVIELPIPKDQWRQMAFFEAQAKEFERLKMPLAEDVRIILEKFKETRTIKIKGKNVDDLDLEKATRLIEEANKKTSLNLKGFLKRFTKSSTNNSQKA